jgi:steroid delta-isomerase-like uncharacterized protein
LGASTVEDNLRLINEIYEAINKRDWDTAFGFHSEDHLRYVSNNVEPMKGLELYREFSDGFTDAFPDLHIEVIRAFGQGDLVCDEHVASGTHKRPMKGSDGQMIPPTGKRFKVRVCHIYKIKAGKVVETRSYSDQLVLLSQLGLVPQG